MKTRVKFVLLEGEVIAIFPDVVDHIKFDISCREVKYLKSYMHVGQHSGCHPELLENAPATPEQYAALKKELESEPFNYELEVIREV